MATLTRVLYTATATAEGGRDGHTATDDGRLDVKLSSPPELGGPAEGIGTNPEQLFAAGYSSCFHSALKLVAQRMSPSVAPENANTCEKVKEPSRMKNTITVTLSELFSDR